jgi:hypothetical protein
MVVVGVRYMFLKGVSEYVSVFIVTIITLAAGLGIFIYAYAVIDGYYSSLSQRIEQAIAEYRQNLDIMASYIRGDEVIVIAVSSDSSVDINAIYINNSLYTCKAYIDNKIYIVDGINIVRAPSLSIAVIKCPIEGALAYIKIVYRGGEVGSWASRII